jgi:DNA-binding transcriptional LysR family regulator
MKYYDLELRELRQILAITMEGSFASAARSLHISQPALSRSIQEVERKVGLRLFERGRAGAEPTDAGRMVIRHAETVLAVASDMQRELALIRGLGAGELRIGAGLFPSELFLGRALADLARPGADVRLRIINDTAPELLKRLRQREIDLMVADPAWLEQATDVRVVPLSTYQGHLIVRSGHPLLGRRPVRLSEVTGYPLVTSASVPPRLARMPAQGKSTQAAMQVILARWTPTIYTDSIAIIKDTVTASDAITLLPLILVRYELDRGELDVLPIHLPWIRASFAVMHLSHRTLSPLAELFIRATVDADATAQAQEAGLARGGSRTAACSEPG